VPGSRQANRAELADVGRLARRLLNRAVETARNEDQPLRRLPLEHLGPDAALLPTVSATWPSYEHVNVQVALDAWLAGGVGDGGSGARGHMVYGITSIGFMSQMEVVGIGDFLGQVISFGPEVFGAGRQAPMNFLERPAVGRDQIVLPDELLENIERQVLGIGRHSGRLLASGQHLKRGILLYGAPGTGKTHTVRYLLSQLPDLTVIVISGRALGRIREACSVARALQPAVVVVEDVDLIAEQREAYPGEQPLLFQLLNEMDGLGSAADVTFLLTTNRADLLEPALASRPGRVDLAAELPLPDAAARRRLIKLYRGDLVLELTGEDALIERTEGVTAAFLKELLRKAALLACEEDEAGEGPIGVIDAHLATALDQLLDNRNQLTRVLLSGEHA
jgi:ATPase family associated with various cellular activities (AAA)